MSLIKRILGLALAAAFLAPVLLAYNVKLKDGSIIFARSKYEVKGAKAIITLQNGTVTQIDLALIDVAGTEQYNRDNPGNVIAIVPGGDKVIPVPVVVPVPTRSLQDAIRARKMRLEARSAKGAAGGEQQAGSPESSSRVDMTVEAAFRNVFDGASITQYRLADFRGKLRLLATTNSEEAVFNTLSAAARALADLGNAGKTVAVEIMLTTSGGESAGSFVMTTDQGRLLVNGGVSVADFFVRNVIL